MWFAGRKKPVFGVQGVEQGAQRTALCGAGAEANGCGKLGEQSSVWARSGSPKTGGVCKSMTAWSVVCVGGWF